MTRKLLFSAIVATVGLLGCATGKVGGATTEAAGPCNAGICKIDVTVRNCGAGCCVNPIAQLDIPERGKPKNIEWDIANGYYFASNGIVIFGDTGQQFGPPDHSNRKKVKVHNRHTESTHVYYVVNVFRDDGTACESLDPYIRNR